MQSNFTFLQAEWQELYAYARDAEQHVFTAPRTSAFYSRLALENAVHWMYDNDTSLHWPDDTDLYNLLQEPSFRNIVPVTVSQNLRYVRKVGNDAAHRKIPPTDQESLAALKFLFNFLEFVVYAYSQTRPTLPKFDESLLPTQGAAEKTRAELQALETKYADQREELHRKEEQLAHSEGERTRLAQQLAEVQTRKEKNREIPFVAEAPYSEAETRRLYINLFLREAGWDIQAPNVSEYEVRGMPVVTNPSGKGNADYVLWGDNGKPLAVVEAKKTIVDARIGQRQAELYANCLEQMTGQRPIIFYTNGFETYLWDDTFYPPRPVQGFYNKDELQLLINRRTARKDLSTIPVNKGIADRYYQERAIRKVTEIFGLKHRDALLVMATGSGKTRTAAALVDVLTKANWVRRILFLADRNALVTQAMGAFKTHLPHLSLIDLTQEKEDTTSRMVFSTYPTMMNLLHGQGGDAQHDYGPGHFDLIIIDEAHRSVYQRYKAIFKHFDALLLGLTATPKAEVDKNTYELFGLGDNKPTDAYELSTAVADKWLVPFRPFSVHLKFPREGIRYQDLTEEEKAAYELTFRDTETGEIPEEIDPSAMNEWLFNTDTVDKVLAHVMEKGLKVEGGDKIGKTIIFARNHKHALFIEQRFTAQYPKYAGHFLRIIDNYDTKAQSLIGDFSIRLAHI